MHESGRTDPITTEVVGNHFLSIADEVGLTLARAAYSTSIKERTDCSVAILDAAGGVIAQAEHIPVHLGSLLGIVQAVHARYKPDEIRPGDIFLTNDPYSGGGTHLPDITVAVPFFCEGELIGYLANTAHHDDIGGGAGRPKDVFGEGLRIPPVKISQGGQLQHDIMEMILLNCRLPDERRGDLQAQFSALHTGLARLSKLGDKYGAATLVNVIHQLYDHAERQAREAIRRIPQGSYEFVDYMDDDGVRDEPVPIRVALEVADGAIRCDFTGSAPQVRGNINVVRSALAACVYYAIKAAVDPTLPANGGYYRAVTFVAPEGSIVNCRPPASVEFRTDTCQRIVDVILGALAQALPDRIPAASHSTVTGVVFSGIDPRTKTYFRFSEGIAGGAGAKPNGDGMDGVQVHMTNSANLPIEALERTYPLRIDRYELTQDSGGAGTYRGGLSITRQYRVLGDEVFFQIKGDRQKVAPWPLQHGEPGSKGIYTVNPDTEDEQVIPTKTFDLPLHRGDMVRVTTPGGAGFGDPRHRPAAMIEQDLVQDRISIEAKRMLYDAQPPDVLHAAAEN